MFDSTIDGQFEDLDAWLENDPDGALIELDRHLVKEGGLRTFMELAWPVIEGAQSSFKANWHIDAISEHLTAVSKGQIQRLAICIPPRHMKSISTAVFWPCWDWIESPWRRYMFSSYAHNLSIRDSVKCRRILASPWFQKRWGGRFKITSDQNTKIRFENDKNGYRLSTSVDGQLTGEGADFIVVDDPHNVRKAESEKKRENTLLWWDEAMSTRLNDPSKGAYVLMQQRVHENDLMGHVLKKSSIMPWTVLCLPAEFEPDHPFRWIRDPRTELGQLLWPGHQGRKQVEELKANLGSYAAAAQLQQRPAPREGGIFKRKWFGEPVSVLPPDCIFVRGWDFAATEEKLVKTDPDWTVGALVAYSRLQSCWFIADINRFRGEPHEVEMRLKRQAEADGQRIHIALAQDPGSAGKSLVKSQHTLLSAFTVFSRPVNGDKMQRALPWAGKAGVGMVKLVKGDWNKEFLDEICSFPNGAHDDQLDAVSTAWDLIMNDTDGLAFWMEKQLAASGVDPNKLKTPSQIMAEKAAEKAAEAQAAKDAEHRASNEAIIGEAAARAAERTGSMAEALAKALLGLRRT